MRRILIVDDEEKLRNLLARIISLEGFEVVKASNCENARKKIKQFPIDVILCDVKLPDGNGVNLTKEIKEKYPEIEIILLTAYGNIPDGVKAIKNGAFDYITKENNNKIIPLLYRALEKVEMTQEIRRLKKRVGSQYFSFEDIIGDSPLITEAVKLAQKVACVNTTVLLTGETGTGKEIFAQAIHRASPRASKEFVTINCAAISKDLLESEMFGHVAGAFTGSTKDKVGLFEEAHKGTIFLDEIGELALDLQAKVLRATETGEFLRVGETKPTKVDVRIIAATNRNLQEEIEKGVFREDLFYRISAFQIQLPPLRERTSDIEALAQHFLKNFAIQINNKIKTIPADYLDLIKKHYWKGNIRELKNIIERSILLSEENKLSIESLPVQIRDPFFSSQDPNPPTFKIADLEKKHIKKILNFTGGNKTKTAELLDIGLTTLYRKMKAYGLTEN